MRAVVHDRFGPPEVLRIEVRGVLPVGVCAKDLALHLLALPAMRAGAGVGRVFEFGGRLFGNFPGQGEAELFARSRSGCGVAARARAR